MGSQARAVVGSGLWPGIGTIVMMLEMLLMLLLPVMTAGEPTCSADSLAVYKLVLETHWSEEMFPKQYPQWRPPAQWSKTVGYTHNGSISLFKTGQAVSDGVRMFVEKGDSDMLERATAGSSFLGTVFAPSIQQGEGRTETLIFVDGNNTKLSLMTAIVPSPDWFIGLASLELCQDGDWLDYARLDASPMDAGTDNGLTFTSPNWATDPRGEVVTITNTEPAHPAASFNYPHLHTLPSIATYSLQKLREFNLLNTTGIKQNKVKTEAERYRYDVNISKANEEEIDFIPLNVSPIGKTNKTTKRKTNKAKSQKTNLQIISQHLTLDPVATKAANATLRDIKMSEDLELVTLLENYGERERKYAEILSNEIPMLDFNNSEFASQNERGNSSLTFVPV